MRALATAALMAPMLFPSTAAVRAEARTAPSSHVRFAGQR
jgi:hypothetical protein